MKKFKTVLFLMMTSVLLIAGCSTDEETGTNDEEGNTDGEKLNIVTSFSVLGDMIGEVAGDRANVDYIVPIGEEPHEYEPVPSDFSKVSDADVFFVNGMNLEEWLERIVANISETPIVELTEGMEGIPLVGEEGVDPHAWLSPKKGIIYVENLVEHLIDLDPEGEEEYRERADAYIDELNELSSWIEEQVETIPEEHRVIIVSENAFKYYGEDYGFITEGIWEINSHEEGTSQQINRVIDIVQDEGIPAVFVESTVDNRYMEMVAENSGVSIAGEVYTDAIGDEDSGADTYLNMLRQNTKTFVEGLGGN
ncbi:metal ABC transporter substrate-binding protein [Bacillus shivajii]|uniref:metal ABC transporter substrate-binding protein n=1 Tax=Bacillus shivajii TaxID=1983719 RepID=UPI001CF9E5D8|nr:metal ABC transporter substrate-binding protein [Bacillus shivajii]UCZ54410.1 metal ABC transporter substrate-binding protein [Bacillus shivajii]